MDLSADLEQEIWVMWESHSGTGSSDRQFRLSFRGEWTLSSVPIADASGGARQRSILVHEFQKNYCGTFGSLSF